MRTNAGAVLPHSLDLTPQLASGRMTDENSTEEKVKSELSNHGHETVQLQSLENPSDKEEIQDPETAEPSSNDGFPEGGLRAWGCVAGSFCVQMVGFGYTTSFGVYQDYYTRFYMTKENPSAISWIGSVNGFLVISTGILAGRLYDKGYLYHILYGASALIVFSLFMLSLSQPNSLYQNFLAQGIGHGLGAGMMYVPSLAVISQYFHRRRALAMSIVASGSSLGAIIHPIMLNNLFVRIGFGNAVRASAGMNAGLLIIGCLLIRPRLPPSTSVPSYLTSVKKFSKDKPYVYAALGLMVFPIGMYFPLFFLQLDAAKQGLSVNFAFYSLVILNGAGFVGRLSTGILTKYITVPPLTVISTFACTVLLYAVSGITTVPAFVVFGILYGFFSGSFISLMAPLISTLCDDYSELGLRMGLAFTLCGVGALVGPPVEGALLGDSFEWWRPAVFSGSLAVLATLMFGAMLYVRRRK